MTAILRVLIGVLTAALVYAGLVLAVAVFGGTECDRGSCNFIGEIGGHPTGRWVLGIIFVGLAVAAGVRVARTR